LVSKKRKGFASAKVPLLLRFVNPKKGDLRGKASYLLRPLII
jgi:hypothetical protein